MAIDVFSLVGKKREGRITACLELSGTYMCN
jgi:hypothetical protein